MLRGPYQHPDDASDEPRDDATGESTHKARGSRLIVKDVGQSFPVAMDIAEGQPLSPEASSLVRWLLEQGETDAMRFLPEVDGLRVVGRCPCGCASIDFTKDHSGSMCIIADFGLKGPDGLPGGVFLFTRGGRLAGLEVYSAGNPIARLPAPESLVPLPLA